MPGESKKAGSADKQVADAVAAGKQPATESDIESGSEADDAPTKPTDEVPSGPKKKKKRSKKKKNAESATGEAVDPDEEKKKKALEGLTHQQIVEFMSLNPALKSEVEAQIASNSSTAGNPADPATILEALKKLRLQDIMTGLASSGKNRKDMASYKFWSTQPVPQFAEEKPVQLKEGPIKIQAIEDIPAEPHELALEGFRWVTVDLNDEHEMQEVYKLLNGHYVEDNEAMFRFNYSPSLLKW